MKWMAWLAVCLLFFAPLTAHTLHSSHHSQHAGDELVEHICSSHSHAATEDPSSAISKKQQLEQLFIACDYCQLLFYAPCITSSTPQLPVVALVITTELTPELPLVSQEKFTLARAREPPRT